MGATRFEAGKQGKLWHTVCPKCKERADSWGHCVDCYQLEVKDAKNEKRWLTNIKEIIKKIKTTTPAKYITSDMQHVQLLEEGANTDGDEEEQNKASTEDQRRKEGIEGKLNPEKNRT